MTMTPIMAPSDIQISKAATKLTADIGIAFRPLGDKDFHESEIVGLLSEYYEKLPESLRQSYAPPDIMTKTTMNTYDPHFLFLLTNDNSVPMMDRVKGLCIFS